MAIFSFTMKVLDSNKESDSEMILASHQASFFFQGLAQIIGNFPEPIPFPWDWYGISYKLPFANVTGWRVDAKYMRYKEVSLPVASMPHSHLPRRTLTGVPLVIVSFKGGEEGIYSRDPIEIAMTS